MKKQKEKHILTNQQGFTLAELLVVVAIIGILVAISVPVFAAQLERSREATDMANVRVAYAHFCKEYIGCTSLYNKYKHANITKTIMQFIIVTCSFQINT